MKTNRRLFPLRAFVQIIILLVIFNPSSQIVHAAPQKTWKHWSAQAGGFRLDFTTRPDFSRMLLRKLYASNNCVSLKGSALATFSLKDPSGRTLVSSKSGKYHTFNFKVAFPNPVRLSIEMKGQLSNQTNKGRGTITWRMGKTQCIRQWHAKVTSTSVRFGKKKTKAQKHLVRAIPWTVHFDNSTFTFDVARNTKYLQLKSLHLNMACRGKYDADSADYNLKPYRPKLRYNQKTKRYETKFVYQLYRPKPIFIRGYLEFTPTFSSVRGNFGWRSSLSQYQKGGHICLLSWKATRK